METIFVGESLIDFNQGICDNIQFQHKLKVGEIFQLRDSNNLSMCCLNCSQEFQYFTEFTLHIHTHGDIAPLKEVKEENIPIDIQNEPDVPIIITPEVKCEIIENDVDDFFNDEPYIGWSDVDDGNSAAALDQAETALTMANPLENVSSIIEGTDYEKLKEKFKCLTCDHVIVDFTKLKEHLLTHSNPKDVMCPICSKLFATIEYVQKHCNRTHNQKISLDKIKEAQPIKHNEQATADFVLPSRLPPLPPPPPLPALKILKTERKTYTSGKDYKKVGEKFQCLTCNRTMGKFDHMKEHLLTHNSEKNVLCPFCARAFITESYVRKHVNRAHHMRITAEEIKAAQGSIDISQKKKEWAIEQNQKMTQTVKKMTTTAAASVAEEGSIRCLFCEKRFTKARYAQKHIRLIHGKPIAIGDVVSFQPASNGYDENKSATVVNDQDENETKEETEKNFECFECHKQFVSCNSVRIHMKLHSGIKYVCPYCVKIFAMKSYVRDHIVIMHGIKREEIPKDSIRQATGNFIYTPRTNTVSLYECYLCRKQYRKRNRLREHMHTHISGPFLCVICGAVYKSTDTLRHHMERHEANPNEPHQCSDCGKTYPTRRYMLSHYRTIHLNKRRKKATVNIERKRDIVCEICDKKFLSQHNKTQHMTVHKRDPNDLICPICGWQFRERSNLKQHLESHGNNKTICEICKKRVSQRYLQEHMKIHSGNKEFQCSTCGKQFVSRERLKRHMVRHSGEPRYKCDIKLCGKAYTRSDKLLYHRRTHDEKMSHTCSTCNKGFFSIKSLRKHENKHYLEDNGILNKSETNNSNLMFPIKMQ